MSLSPRVLATLIPVRSRFDRRWLPRATVVVGLALWTLALTPGPGRAALSNVRVDLTAFSPNGDGIRDSVRVQWTASAPPESLRVEIRPAAQGTTGPALRAYAFGPGAAGPGFVTWDGRDTLGTIAADGLYLCRVLELAQGGATVVTDAPTSTLLDITPPPVARFDDGLDGRDTTAAAYPVSGIAPAADSVTIFVGGAPRAIARVGAADSAFSATVAIAPGANAIAVQGFDRAGNRGPLSPAITITSRVTADIVFLRAVPFESSPNADGVLDSVRAQLVLDAPTTRLTVQVRAAVPPFTGDRFADALNWIRTLSDAPADSGEHSFAWDGRDSTGAAVGEGSWFFFAQAESADASGAPVPGRRVFARFLIDLSPPAVPVLSPAPPARTTRNSVTLAGFAADADSVHAFRDDVLFARVPAPTWSLVAGLVLGANTFRFESVERSGNRSARSAPVTILYEEPLGFHAPERFRAGDVFDVNLTRTGRSVRIDLYELGGRRVRTLSVTQATDRYELPWNLADDEGRTVGDGPYVARATVTYADGVVETRSGAVVVAK